MDISLITFQSQTFGELISLVQLPRVGVPEEGYEHFTPQGGLYLFMVFYAHSGILVRLHLHVSYPSNVEILCCAAVHSQAFLKEIAQCVTEHLVCLWEEVQYLPVLPF